MTIPKEMEPYKYKGHWITVRCEERGRNRDLYWRFSIRKNGDLKKHEPSSPKPFDTCEQAVAEGKKQAEEWVDSNLDTT